MDERDVIRLVRLGIWLVILVAWVAIWWWRRREAGQRSMGRIVPPPAPRRIPPPPASLTSRPEFRANPSPARQPATGTPAPIQPRSLNLDATAFAPLSHDQAKRASAGFGSAFGDPFAGRRDLIPPADDPRTAVIDRAMVGQGLITPEALAEIHRVGEQMDAVRPQLAHAQQAADRTVRDAKEERAKLKEQKKHDAAERKRLHAQAVAQRRKTDIIFLGRGVSKGLADRTSDIARLQAANLPVLSTPADVALALKLTIPRLRWLAFHADASSVSHYVRFTVPKRRGGVRHLSAPHNDLAAAQQWVLENILAKVPTHDAAHGFVPGRSTVTNAVPHVGRRVLVNADLVDFFPSITFPRVAGIFRMLGYSPAVATVLALLCTDAPRKRVVYAGKPLYVAAGPRALPQGACTSPALSNLAARRMDARLGGIATKLGWTYTRYADDLSFSAGGGDGAEGAADKVGYLLARVRHIAQDERFAVNEAKTRVQRRSDAQIVTGLVVNDRPNVRRDVVRRLRAILHRAQTGGLAAQNRENHPHFDAWVRGMIGYVAMVNPQQGARLREALVRLDSTPGQSDDHGAT